MTQAKLFYEKIENGMFSLYDRWKEESEYENFQDYKNQIQRWANEFDIKILSMSKRPFAFIGEHNNMKFRIKVTAESYCLERFPL